MNVFQSCSDISDATPLSTSQGLYLKPVARLNISVQLPSLKIPGKTISNWEVMEKLRHYAAPEDFVSLKVSKSTLEVVRFEGEIENRSKLSSVLARLDGRSLKLSGFHESLKVRAAEAKPDFPTRHSWDSYFRDAKNMNEMKPGERPDTIHISNLPCKWFAAKSDGSKPSEYILRKVFEIFGEVRCVDIPMLDPFRSQMKSHISGIKMFSNNQNMIFEAYVQFKEYICFVKTMDALRGMKLLHKDADGKTFTASIKVDFDKTKHLSDSSIRRRRVERERLTSKEREREERERQVREEEERKLLEERKRIEKEKEAKLERQQQREERRKAKQLELLKQREAEEMNQKIATEERLLLIAQRRLESFRLLGELFNRLKIIKEKECDKYKDRSLNRKHRDRHKDEEMDKLADNLKVKEKELREKLVKKFKHSDQNDQRNPVPETVEHKTDSESGMSDPEHLRFGDNFEVTRNSGRGGFRGNRGNRLNRRRRGNSQFRGNAQFRRNQFPPLPFQSLPLRGAFFSHRGFPRWPHFSPRSRGGDHSYIPPPFIDTYYLDSAMNDPYYKYFHKIALGGRESFSRSRSRSRSRSYSRSYSRTRSRAYTRSRTRSRSRSRTRSRSRSRTRSKSRNRTKSRSRSQTKHHRSYSRNQTRRKSRSHSKSRKSRSRRSRSGKRCSSRNRSRSSKHSNKNEKNPDETLPEVSVNEKYVKKLPSVHTWSRSPSRSRSLSWEKRKDNPSSSTKSCQKSKKEKKKDKKDKKRKKKKDVG